MFNPLRVIHPVRSSFYASALYRRMHQSYQPVSAVLKNDSVAGEPIPVISPSTSKELTTVISASPDLISATIENAQNVFDSGVWSRAPAITRSKVLSKLARLLEGLLEEFVDLETVQTGRAIREMKAQLARLPEWLDYYAALLRTQDAGTVAPTQGNLLNYVTRVPLGVVAQILPFNHPLLIGIKKIAPALATGNSVIVKPSEVRLTRCAVLFS